MIAWLVVWQTVRGLRKPVISLTSTISVGERMDTVLWNVHFYISELLLFQKIQMAVNSGLDFNLLSEVECRESGTSPEGQITHWDVRVTEVRSRHLVCLSCVEPRAPGQNSEPGLQLALPGFGEFLIYWDGSLDEHLLSHLCDCAHAPAPAIPPFFYSSYFFFQG